MEEVEPRDADDMSGIACCLAKETMSNAPRFFGKTDGSGKTMLNMLGFEIYKSCPVHYIMFHSEQTGGDEDNLKNVILRTENAITTNPALLQYHPKLLAAGSWALYSCDDCLHKDILGYKEEDLDNVKNALLATRTDKHTNVLVHTNTTF